jgi:dihydrofolate reductase
VRGNLRIEGYAITSGDGMIADATGFMPNSLKFEADQRFFVESLDRVQVVCHGRLSHEGHPESHARRRLILTRRVTGLTSDPDNSNTWLWNPAGATLDEACAAVGCGAGTLAIAGGTEVYSLFLTIGYDVFYLARAEEVRLPGGMPVFSQGRSGRSPEDTLREAGLKPAETCRLEHEVSLVKWTA